MRSLTFIEVAQDPDLIPGVYEKCDQWCAYCPLTARCLAHRLAPRADTTWEDRYANLMERLYESLKFLKRLGKAQGRSFPEIETMLATDPRSTTHYEPIDDPLERMARRYALLASAYLSSRDDYPLQPTWRPDGPTALEVLDWFHIRIAAKIYRAIMSSVEAAREVPGRSDDAQASAKVALIGIERSSAALKDLEGGDADARIEEMTAHLGRLADAVDARFPGARAYLRAGFE